VTGEISTITWIVFERTGTYFLFKKTLVGQVPSQYNSKTRA
jgi:hypothetical protein